MTAATYDAAMIRVFGDEGGYTNDPVDPGGATNFGITIIDARKYWKPNATPADVKTMPKAVASDIYRKHYANPMRYDDLPAGFDYSILDAAINPVSAVLRPGPGRRSGSRPNRSMTLSRRRTPPPTRLLSSRNTGPFG
jgi:lysozyme family protein